MGRDMLDRQPDTNHRMLVRGLGGIASRVGWVCSWVMVGQIKRAHACHLEAQAAAVEASVCADDINQCGRTAPRGVV